MNHESVSKLILGKCSSLGHRRIILQVSWRHGDLLTSQGMGWDTFVSPLPGGSALLHQESPLHKIPPCEALTPSHEIVQPRAPDTHLLVGKMHLYQIAHHYILLTLFFQNDLLFNSSIKLSAITSKLQFMINDVKMLITFNCLFSVNDNIFI